MQQKTLLALVFIIGTAFAVPDIQVTNVEYSQSTQSIIAAVHNRGPDDVKGPVLFEFYDGSQKIGEELYDSGIAAYKVIFVSLEYELKGEQHQLRVAASILNNADANAGNNERAVDLIISQNASENVVPLTREELANDSVRATGLYIGAAILALAALAAGIGRMRRRKAPQQVQQVQQAPQQAAKIFKEKETDMQKIRDIAGLPAGTRVRFRAQLLYQDRVGQDHVYFLKDSTDEIIGISKDAIEKKEAVISGAVEHFLGESTAVKIERAE